MTPLSDGQIGPTGAILGCSIQGATFSVECVKELQVKLLCYILLVYLLLRCQCYLLTVCHVEIMCYSSHVQ